METVRNRGGGGRQVGDSGRRTIHHKEHSTAKKTNTVVPDPSDGLILFQGALTELQK